MSAKVPQQPPKQEQSSLEKVLAPAFNEWQRRYMEDPKGFDDSWTSVKETMAELSKGEIPSYGQACAAYLLSIVDDLEK